MAQTPEYNIKQEMQNLILNYPKPRYSRSHRLERDNNWSHTNRKLGLALVGKWPAIAQPYDV